MMKGMFYILVDYLNRNPSGGSLHIILDDKNLDDGSCGFCATFAKEENDPIGECLAIWLLGMTETQRYALLGD